MKRIQKLLVFMCALVATIAIAVPAYAEDSSITIKSETGGHTYTAYQIFSGNYDNTVGSSATLSNIQWGDDVKDAEVLSALKGDATIGDYFSKCSSAADVAAVLQNETAADESKVFANNSDAIDAFATVVSDHLKTAGKASTTTSTSSPYMYIISGLDDGYYLVKDSIAGDTAGNACSKLMIQLVGNVSVDAKADVPTITKKVTDINDTTGDTSTDDSADYDIDDDVSFTITATVADNLADYEVYKFVIHDTLAAGLALNENSVKVAVGQTEITDYTLEPNPSDSCSFEIQFANLRNVTGVSAGSPITVTYTAKLGNDAKIGGSGNDNTATLEYSNDPNDSTGKTMGKTVSDTVTVFTYQLIVNKVDDTTPNGNPLAGAAFKLEKKIKGSAGAEDFWEPVKGIEAAANRTEFVFKGLDDGTYKLTETATPAGYNTMEPVEFTIVATHDADDQNPELDSLDASGGSLTFATNLADGSLSVTIKNLRGATLPSTGGMGKTVLITAGAILVVGAGVGLVAKYRASRMK